MGAKPPNIRRQGNVFEGRIVIAYRDGTKKRQSFYGPTADDVKEQMRRAQLQRRNFQPKNITVKDFLTDVWLPAIEPIDGVSGKPRVRFSTYCIRKQTIDKHLVPAMVNGRPFGDYKLDDVTAGTVRQMLAALERTHVGGRARQVAYETLRAALHYAISIEYVEQVATAHVPRPEHKPKPTLILTEPQFARLLRAVDANPYRALFTLAVTTGMRQGELLALRWGQVNFDAGTLTVNATLTRLRKGSGNLGASAPKTDTANREIVLVRDTLDALRSHRKDQLAKGRACEWVFATKNGTPIERNNFREEVFHPLLAAADCPKITFHSFRHLVATLLAEEETNPKALQDLLGHKDYRTTANIYAKSTPRLRQHAADKMQAVLTRIRGVDVG